MSSPSPAAPDRRADLVAALLIAGFALIGCWGLDRAPAVFVDEPWVAEPGYRFWQTGRFASEMFRGEQGSERAFLGFVPAASLWVGAFLSLFGVSLTVARASMVAMAVGILVLTHLIGRRLLSPWHGVAAVAVLGFWPLAAAQKFHVSGIPLLDLARLVRHDLGVALFGLGALAVLGPLLAEGRQRAALWRAALAGGIAGLAALSHVYGMAWWPALAAALILVGGRQSAGPVALLTAGFLAALAPWVIFCALHPTEFVEQNFRFADRVQLLSPRFYVENLLTEWHRYRPLLQALRQGQPASWLWVLALMGGAVALLRSPGQGSRGRKAPALIAGLLMLSFALVLRPRDWWYLAPLWPLLALVVAHGLLEGAARVGSLRWRPLLAGAAALLVLIGSVRALGRLAAAARRSSPYPAVAAELRRRVPAGARLLGPTLHWFALEGHVATFRTLNVPLHRYSTVHSRRPDHFEDFLAGDRLDHLLVDGDWLRYLHGGGRPGTWAHGLNLEIRRHLDRQGQLLVRWPEPTYGPFELHRLMRAALPRPTPLGH